MKQEVSKAYVFIHDEKGFCALGNLYVGQTNFLFLYFIKTKKELGLPGLFHSVL